MLNNFPFIYNSNLGPDSRAVRGCDCEGEGSVVGHSCWECRQPEVRWELRGETGTASSLSQLQDLGAREIGSRGCDTSWCP